MLNDSVVARIAGRLAEAIRHTLTKKGLGKVVPVVGILVGGALNWTTLEGIVDTADMAYRRRFLLEKYPQLADEEPISRIILPVRSSVLPMVVLRMLRLFVPPPLAVICADWVPHTK